MASTGSHERLGLTLTELEHLEWGWGWGEKTPASEAREGCREGQQQPGPRGRHTCCFLPIVPVTDEETQTQRQIHLPKVAQQGCHQGADRGCSLPLFSGSRRAPGPALGLSNYLLSEHRAQHGL